MAITTYTELQSAVLSWLNRSDTETTDRVTDFIALAETRMMRKLRLRLFETEATLATVVGSRFIALPTDWREPLNTWFVVAGSGREAMDFIQPTLMEARLTNSRPYYWGIDGSNICFEVPADQIYSIIHRYIQKLALSVASPTNTLLTQYPDAYLTATLAEACRFLKDPQAAQMWDDKHNQIGHDIREEESRSKSPAMLHTEPGQMTYRTNRFNINVGY